jgi:hypothetical protein
MAAITSESRLCSGQGMAAAEDFSGWIEIGLAQRRRWGSGIGREEADSETDLSSGEHLMFSCQEPMDKSHHSVHVHLQDQAFRLGSGLGCDAIMGQCALRLSLFDSPAVLPDSTFSRAFSRPLPGLSQDKEPWNDLAEWKRPRDRFTP